MDGGIIRWLLQVDGLNRVTSELSKVGQTADKELSKANKRFGNFGKSIGSATRKLGKLAGTFGLVFGTAGAVSLLNGSIDAFKVQEDAVAQVDKAIERVGETAGFTSKELQGIASELQSVTTFGDESILRDVSTQLLTFGNVQGEVFEQAQVAVLDLATVLEKDLASTSIQLGKALNDPIRGLSALSESGITFTDAQRELVAGFVEVGDATSAQQLILDEVAQFYGGSAAAAADTLGGKQQQLANRFGDVQEVIGGAILGSLVNIGQKFVELAESIASPAGFIRTTLIPAFQQASNFIVSIFTPVIQALINLWNNSLAPAFKRLQPVLKFLAIAIGVSLVTSITALAVALQVVIPIVGFLINIFSRVVRFIYDVLAAAINFIKNIFSLSMSDISTAVSAGIDNVITFFRELPGRIISAMGDLAGLLLGAGKDIMLGLLNGIKEGATAVFDGVKDVVGGVKDFVTSGFGIFSPSRVFSEYGDNLMQGFADGISDGAGNALNEVSNVVDGVNSAAFNSSNGARSVGGDNISITVNTLASSREDARRIAEELQELLNEKNRTRLQSGSVFGGSIA